MSQKPEPERIKFSVIVTVLNEAATIGALLDSLRDQKLKPAELIIVDAGSKDETVALIRTWSDNHSSIPVNLVLAQGANRSEGRNKGIELAENEHLAILDAGCIADDDWLQQLASAFSTDKAIDSVAGFYIVRAKTILERCFGWYTAIEPSELNTKAFLPSSRSIALTRTAWKKVGGYPEELITCEDLVFSRRLKDLTQMVVNTKAVVYWRPASSLGQYFMQIFGYARGDMAARYIPHMRKIHLIWLRYFFFIWVPWSFVVYLGYPWWKFRKRLRRLARNKLEYYFLLPIVQIVTDVAVMLGSIRGLVKR